MIGRLRGTLLTKRPPSLVIDVQGVGYELEAPMTTFYKLPELGQEVTLVTHLVVREDAQQLFGFAEERERSLFRSLLRVNGIGARLALTILSGIEADVFVRCVNEHDTVTLSRLPGVGKKTAERLIIEMRDRLVDWQGKPAYAVEAMINARKVAPSGAVEEAISALVALGYKLQEASRAVQAVETREGMTSEELIREALRSMVRK